MSSPARPGRAIRALALVCLVALTAQVAAQMMRPATEHAPAPAQASLPLEKGLPLKVKVAVAFPELQSFNENAGTYKASVDVRLRWEDPGLRLPPSEANAPPKVFRGAEAEAQLAKI